MTKRTTVAFAIILAVLIATPLVVSATDRFGDVPNNNPHHNDITWLADAGVTLGCNPPANTNYCPNQAVRRDQMASFLKRLAQNQVVDAGALAGQGPDAYRSVVGASLDDPIGGTSSSSIVETNNVSIEAPSAGYLVVSGSIYVVNNTGALNALALFPTVNGNPAPGAAGSAIFDLLGNGGSTSLAYTVVFPVDAGTHTVAQSASVTNGNIVPIAGDFFWNSNDLVVVWHPEGSISLSTAGSDGGSQTGD